MAAPQVSFRPFIELTETYDTGLTSVSVNDQGDLANASAAGSTAAWGISGVHSWRQAKLGLDYRGSLSHYTRQTSFDSLTQSLLLGFSSKISKHSEINLRISAGYFSRAFGLVGLQETVPFDPSSTYIPTTDFFDNRTAYVSTQFDYKIQKKRPPVVQPGRRKISSCDAAPNR